MLHYCFCSVLLGQYKTDSHNRRAHASWPPISLLDVFSAISTDHQALAAVSRAAPPRRLVGRAVLIAYRHPGLNKDVSRPCHLRYVEPGAGCARRRRVRCRLLRWETRRREKPRRSTDVSCSSGLVQTSASTMQRSTFEKQESLV